MNIPAMTAIRIATRPRHGGGSLPPSSTATGRGDDFDFFMTVVCVVFAVAFLAFLLIMLLLSLGSGAKSASPIPRPQVSYVGRTVQSVSKDWSTFDIMFTDGRRIHVYAYKGLTVEDR